MTLAKTAAEKDNRTVYMEPVPLDSQLVAVVPVCMVAPAKVPMAILAPYGGAESGLFFASILPKGVKQLASATREKVRGI